MTPVPDAGAGAPATCWAEPSRLYFFEPGAPLEVADVTGDGAPDPVIHERAESGYALVLGAGREALVEVASSDGYLLSVLAAQANGDGVADLVVGVPWASEVRIFHGPLAGTRAWSTADVVFTADTGGGLENRFGESYVLTDVDADGAVDIVIAAPAEGEEGCLGQEPLRVYLAPFDTEPMTREAAAFELVSPTGVCLGEQSACGANDLTFQAPRGEPKCFAYALPLREAEAPSACP